MSKHFSVLFVLFLGASIQIIYARNWVIDSHDVSDEDEALLKQISSLAFKHLLRAANVSVTELKKITHETAMMQDQIDTLKQLMKTTNESMAEKYAVCNAKTKSETCYSCSQRKCYEAIGSKCDLDDMIPTSQKLKEKGGGNKNKPGGSNNLLDEEKPEKNIEEIMREENRKLEDIEKQMKDEKTPIGSLNNLFLDMADDFETFDDNMMDEIGDKSTTTMIIFADDIKELGRSAGHSGRRVFNAVDDDVETMRVMWRDLSMNMDYVSSRHRNYIDSGMDGAVDSSYRVSKASVGFSKDALEGASEMAGMLADEASEALDGTDEAAEEVLDAVNSGAEKTADVAKQTYNKLKKFKVKTPWKRSVDRVLPAEPDICEIFMAEGEFKLCKRFEKEPECEESCEKEKDKAKFCSEALELAQMMENLVDKVDWLFQKQQDVAAEALRDHAWVKVLLQTVNYGNAYRDDRKIEIKLIETDPSKFDLDRPWLFKDVFVEFSLKQVDSTPPQYKVVNRRAKLEDPSNLMNLYWRNSAVPLTDAVIKEINAVFQSTLQ